VKCEKKLRWLYEDGFHIDGGAGDGIFGNKWNLAQNLDLEKISDSLMQEIGYGYNQKDKILDFLKQMTTGSIPTSYEDLATLVQDIIYASRYRQFDINEDSFLCAVKRYNPAFSLFFNEYLQEHRYTWKLDYLLKAEKGFQEYYESELKEYENLQDQLRTGQLSQSEYISKIEEMSQYSTDPGKNWHSALYMQRKLLLELWDGRDALTGRKLEWDEAVDRHHYEIIGWDGRDPIFMHFDCQLIAQVPLSKWSHGQVAARENAADISRNFERVMEKLMRGEWATPDWWEDAKAIESFEENLVRLGYVRPDNLDR
jgi:hypothetical protein